MEGVEVNICCRMDNQGNVTPMVDGRVVQVLAGVATLPTIAIVLNVSTTDQPLASLIKLQSSEDAKAVFTFRKIYIGKQSLQADGHNFWKIYHVFLSSCDNLQLFSTAGALIGLTVLVGSVQSSPVQLIAFEL